MLNYLRNLIPDRHPLRLMYHKIMAFLAAVIYRFPADDLIVIGITGTNGKTTTSNMLADVLTASGFRVGMSSTIAFQIGEEKWINASKQTTMGPFFLQKLLRRMVDEGCKYAVVEVTSHAVDQSRILGINIDVAVITNVTADHVEYHGDFNSYLNAKGGLFRHVVEGRRKLNVPKILALNADDQYFNYFDQFVADRQFIYGVNGGTIRAENIEKKAEGSKFKLVIPNDSVDVEIPMPGDFNIYNALAVAAVCVGLGLPLPIIARGLSEVRQVSGRFDRVMAGQDFSVVVDYAHTPDALESLLALYKGLTVGKLFIVFGCTGGGRDKSKRPVMGEIADRLADYVIVTNDDPYTEDEWGIIEQVSGGIKRTEGDRFWKIPDRREAIRLALLMAKNGDTVLVAGKGAEEIMIDRRGKIPWNDKKVIGELLNREIKIAL
ncbi:UDP-N-acetylmuramoyl-L-alanyl-D-glutamate--2,6-diaminopimelate ligase [Candidatus Peregrinibacteria bacterium]|nr:UDP-N-acetylmuramoyl-L-alanyl-D-glutamate--2,6-diaminopimelate ligase [Candidatus Peregrinibacteria bacterium]